MYTVISFLILDEALDNSYWTYNVACYKINNSFFSFGLIQEQITLFNLDMAIGLGEGKYEFKTDDIHIKNSFL